MDTNTNLKGRVMLVGAGPGDPELLTIKAARCLAVADVILSDRLVSEEIFKQFVTSDTEIIRVGKQCRRGVSTPQSTINELMIKYAQQGKYVVRLKGGDVSVFSNIMDELQVLKMNGIEYEIVPGITAALGAAAYAGIPLTARGYSTAVRFLTYYKSDVVSEAYWQQLAETDDTLVFYMSSETLDVVVAKLKNYNIGAEKMIAVAEQATTSLQQVHISSFDDYAGKLQDRTFLSPSLVIIGKVVALHKEFAWLKNSDINEYYFEPLVAKLSTIDNTKENKHVSRA